MLDLPVGELIVESQATAIAVQGHCVESKLVPVVVPDGAKLVRLPYSMEFVPCVCSGESKDDCVRISETIQSNSATANHRDI